MSARITMVTTTRQIRRAGPSDLDGVLALLRAHDLLLDGLAEHISTTFVASQQNVVIGSAALEMYPDGALLRSVAVDTSNQGQGIARQLIEAALQLAADLGAPAVYLLTTTAAGYFPRLGFEPIERASVPGNVGTSIEFKAECCASAIVMRKVLTAH